MSLIFAMVCDSSLQRGVKVERMMYTLVNGLGLGTFSLASVVELLQRVGEE